jgi:hypothetical protein
MSTKGEGHAPKIAMSAPRPSCSGCAARKRSTPISFFGIIDSRNEGSVRRNPPVAPAVVSSAGGDEEEDEGIAVAPSPLVGLGPRVVTAAAPALLAMWSGAEQAGSARRRRTWELFPERYSEERLLQNGSLSRAQIVFPHRIMSF